MYDTHKIDIEYNDYIDHMNHCMNMFENEHNFI